MKKLCLITALIAVPAFCQYVPMFRGSLEHAGVYNATGARQFNRVQWRFETAGRVISSPVFAGGVVFAGSTDQNLYAIDQENGTLKWKFHTDSWVTSSPAVSDGTVFFGSFDGSFYAVDAASGKLKWKFETEGERRFAHKRLHGLQPSGELIGDTWDFYLSSPAVYRGAVYFGSGDGNVYALDASTGAVKWKFHTGDVVHASPAISNGLVVIGSWDGILYALQADSGKVAWQFQAGVDPKIGNQQGFQSSAAVANGVVYVGCRDSNVYAIDLKTGQKKWAVHNGGSWVITSPAVDDGKVYYGTSDTGLFHALDAATGAKLLSFDAKFPVFSSPAIAGGALYVGSFDGKLHAVDLKTLKPLWDFTTEASKQNAPALTGADGRLDFGKVIRFLFVDEMNAGLVKLFATGSVVSSPAIDKDAVYFGSTDGAVYALR
jgi:eukaryotic-like serine/threonine-protein kinase